MLRVAVAGTGAFGRNHLRVYSELPGVTLAAAIEPNAERAAEVDGFFAADSMVRRLHSERVVLFSGARALLMQACEPLGVVGFQRHSIIFDDPRLRLQRTDERMSRIYFGTHEGFVIWVFVIPFALVGAILYGFGRWSERVGSAPGPHKEQT